MASLPVRMTRGCPHLMSQSRYSLAFPDGNKGAQTGGEHGGARLRESARPLLRESARPLLAALHTSGTGAPCRLGRAVFPQTFLKLHHRVPAPHRMCFLLTGT